MNSSGQRGCEHRRSPSVATGRKVAPISLIFTVLNAEADITDLLVSIGRQSVLPAELLISDLGSTDGTRQVIASWRAPVEIVVKVIESPGASTSEGRNLAIESASFAHIAVTHGASRLHRDWLAWLWGAMLQGSEAAAGLIQPTGSSLMERVIGRVELRSVDETSPAPLLPPSSSLAFSKDVWDQVGGYPEWLRFGQDKAFDQAVRQSGVNFQFVPSARSSWNPRQSLTDYLEDGFDTSRAVGRATMYDVVLVRLVVAYVCGALALLLFPRSAIVRAISGAAFSGRFAPFLLRVWRTRKGSPDRLVPRLLTTIVVVMAGDAAKLFGYPIGRVTALWADQDLGHQARTGPPRTL